MQEHLNDKFWLLALLLVVATFVAYQPVWNAGYIWDDNDHLTANPAMTAPHGLRMIWSSLATSRYYPLSLTTFWIGRHLWGLNPLPYHLVNVALHALSGVLVLALLRRLGLISAWFAAMAWALHPVNVESVAWITELKNTQSGVFFFLALLSFLRFESTRGRRWYGLALVFGLAAMLSKPSTVVLPLILLLCVWWQRGRCQPGDALRVVPFFGMALGMSVVAVIEQHAQILRAGTHEWKMGIAERIVIAGKAIWFYALKLLWPTDLAFVYTRWNIEAGSVANWLPAAALVAAVVFLWVRRRQSWARTGIFGLSCFIVALLPTLDLFDIYYFRYSFVADHFQYLASVAFISVATIAGMKASERTGELHRDIRRCGTLVILIILAVLTWKHAHAFVSDEALWRDTLAKNPNCWLAHNNLSLQMLVENKAQEALAHAEKAVQSQPDFFEGHNSFALALAHSGRIQDAIVQYQEALRLKPDSAEVRNNLGNALLQIGRVEDALAHYQQAVRIRPNYAEAHNNLGNTLLRVGQIQNAIEHFDQALRIKPDYAVAHNNLGFALSHVGRFKDAIVQYDWALRIQPDYPQALNNLAWLLATLGPAQGSDPLRAVALAEQCCRLTGDQVAAYLDTLAAAYAASGRFNDAVVTAQKASDLAQSSGQNLLTREIENHLKLYRAGQIYQQTADEMRSPGS